MRNKNSKAEVALRSALWRKGLRYRLHSSKVVGKPDIVFPSARVVVFVDGDFWHGRGIIEDGITAFRATMRTHRRHWWIQKLRKNIARDQLVTKQLRRAGWRVVRVWESDVAAGLERISKRIEIMVLKLTRVRSNA